MVSLANGIANPYQCNPALVIHHMQGIVLLDSASPDNALILKDAVNVDGDFHLPALFAHQLLYPLPTGIIEIMGMDSGFAAVGLGAVDPHPVCIVPLEMA